MKDKKNKELEKKAQTNDTAEEMQELDEGDLAQVSGAGNPFDRPRMGFQKIDEDLRNNG